MNSYQAVVVSLAISARGVVYLLEVDRLTGVAASTRNADAIVVICTHRVVNVKLHYGHDSTSMLMLIQEVV